MFNPSTTMRSFILATLFTVVSVGARPEAGYAYNTIQQSHGIALGTQSNIQQGYQSYYPDVQSYYIKHPSIPSLAETTSKKPPPPPQAKHVPSGPIFDVLESPANSERPPTAQAPQSIFGAPAQASSSYGAPALTSLVDTSIFVYNPPVEDEAIYLQQQAQISARRKNVKIIFIKAPSVPQLSLQQQATQVALNEEKTIVYVLVKKPEKQSFESEVFNAIKSPPSKPEVYFIKYKTQSGTSTETDYEVPSTFPQSAYGPPAVREISYGQPVNH